MKPSHPLCFRCCRHHDPMRRCPDDPVQTDSNLSGLWIVLFAIPAIILLAGLISHCFAKH